MPTYEYQCVKCKHQLEAFQAMSDQPLVECPNCHEASLTKLVSAAGFQLKGSGWYVTDYSKKGKAAATESESKPATDAKPASSDTKSNEGSS